MATQYEIGDEVGYGFNGDRYSAGRIVRITARFIHTDQGDKFTKKGEHYHKTGMPGWWMSKGSHEKQNPHF